MDGKKILVVDDDLDIVNIICATLRSDDNTFIRASDGVEAVEKVLTEAPDLVILDIMMPRMNGYQVCRLLKNDRSTWHIPVIILTARVRGKDRFYGVSVGADDYLAKPFHPSELREKVKKQLDRTVKIKKACPIEAPTSLNEATLLSRVNSLLDKKLQEMTFLQDMTKAMVSTFDEEKILGLSLDGIKEYLGYSRMVVYMLDAAGSMLEIAETGYPTHEGKYAFVLRDAGAMSALLDKKEPVVLDGHGPHAPQQLTSDTDDASNFQHACIPIMSREEVRGVLLIDRKEGEPPLSEDRVGVLTTLAGQLGLAIENARLYRATLQMSITDGLTGLYNARYFYERLDDEISRAERYGHELSLFMLDIDHFKRYNDTFGHLSGDEALKHLARILRESSRDTDTVARYGGEEFCVILPETPPEKAVVLAERIRSAVEVSSFDAGSGRNEMKLTVSIGISTMPKGLVLSEELVRMADKALYKSKDSGRNRVSVCC